MVSYKTRFDAEDIVEHDTYTSPYKFINMEIKLEMGQL